MRFWAPPQNQNISASNRIQGKKPRISSCHQGRPEREPRISTSCCSSSGSSSGSSTGGLSVTKLRPPVEDPELLPLLEQQEVLILGVSALRNCWTVARCRWQTGWHRNP